MLDWRKVALWAILLVGAFLIGFVPQWREVGRLRGEVKASEAAVQSIEERVAALQSRIKLGELRDLASLIYLDANRKNFGVARQRSTELFTLTSELAAETSDPQLRSLLEGISKERDLVTASLAKGDPSTQEVVLSLLQKFHEGVPEK